MTCGRAGSVSIRPFEMTRSRLRGTRDYGLSKQFWCLVWTVWRIFVAVRQCQLALPVVDQSST